MAGTVVASTINNDTGLFSTNNAYLGIAKAWAKFQGGNGNTAGVIISSFNVSSITVNGTGDYTANFTTAMSDANYSCQANTINGTSNQVGRAVTIPYNNSATTSAVRMATFVTTNASAENELFVSFAIFGN